MVKARRIFPVVIAMLAVVVAVPQPALAKRLVPFHATISETFTAAICAPAQLCVTATGSGEATYLGKTREFAAIVSDLASDPAPGCHTETRTTILTAVNGDQIGMAATGQNCSTGPTTVTAVDSYVVTGGTGRFTGASGSGTNTASIDQVSGTAVVTYTGTLSSPGSLQ